MFNRLMNWFWKIIPPAYTVATLALTLMILYILTNDRLIEDSHTINQLSLIALLVSLPASVAFVWSLYGKRKNANYKLSGKCPKCHHEVHFKMEIDHEPTV